MPPGNGSTASTAKVSKSLSITDRGCTCGPLSNGNQTNQRVRTVLGSVCVTPVGTVKLLEQPAPPSIPFPCGPPVVCRQPQQKKWSQTAKDHSQPARTGNALLGARVTGKKKTGTPKEGGRRERDGEITRGRKTETPLETKSNGEFEHIVGRHLLLPW